MTTLQNLYVDPNINADGITLANRSRNIRNGTPIKTAVAFYNDAGTDSVNSVYRFFKNLDGNVVPLKIIVMKTAAQTSHAVSIGLYRPNLSLTTAPASGGQAVFLSATSVASAKVSFSEGTAYDGMVTYWSNLASATTNPTPATYGDQRLFEIAGDSLVDSGTAAPYLGNPRQYDLCMKVTTATSVAGIIGMMLVYYDG
jgi:hypothetical protein